MSQFFSNLPYPLLGNALANANNSSRLRLSLNDIMNLIPEELVQDLNTLRIQISKQPLSQRNVRRIKFLIPHPLQTSPPGRFADRLPIPRTFFRREHFAHLILSLTLDKHQTERTRIRAYSPSVRLNLASISSA